MAQRKPNQTPKPTGPAITSAFVRRHLNKPTFLTLEHASYMALVVIVPGIIALALIAAISMWTGSAAEATGVSALLDSGMRYLTAVWSTGLIAALVVLAPLLIILERRTRTGWATRPGYTNRLAYKLPVYVALGILAAYLRREARRKNAKASA
jgi:hypothetical protein